MPSPFFPLFMLVCIIISLRILFNPSIMQIACFSFLTLIYVLQVLVNKDEVSELQSENRILRPRDEREVNRIKPNPTLKFQPVFVDLGFSKKSAKDKQSHKGISKGLCLEITGRVQHDSNDQKYFMMENQLATASNENVWHASSGNGVHMEDDGECIPNYDK